MMQKFSRAFTPRHGVSLFVFTALALGASAALAEQPAVDASKTSSAPSPTMEALLSEGAADKATTDASANAADSPAQPQKSGGSSPVSLLLFAFGAGLICIAGVGAAKYGRRTPKIADEKLEHVQSMRLGNKHQISVVEVHGQLLLLGLADGHICLLDRLDALPREASTSEEASSSPREDDGGEDLTSAWDTMFKRAVSKRQQELATKYGDGAGQGGRQTDGSTRSSNKLTSLADEVSSRASVKAQVTENSGVHDGLFDTFESSAEDLSSRLSEASIARHEERRASRRAASRASSRTSRADEWRREESRESDSVLIALKKFRDVGA